MKIWKPVVLGLMVAALAAVSVDSSLAQSGAQLVKQRQSLMHKMGRAFGPIMPIVRGQNNNAHDAVAALTTLTQLASRIIASFPPGTGRDAVATTRAKPEVWTKRADFEAAAKTLASASASMLEAAKANDVNAFRARFPALVRACGGCHRGRTKQGGKFRFPKEQ